MSEPTKRKRLEETVMALAQSLGLSPDKPEDGWKLAIWLTAQLIEEHSGNKRRGRRISLSSVLQDGVLLAGFYGARREGDTRSEHAIIRDIARHNGWRTDDASINTLWRRYQDMKDKNSVRYKRFLSALRGELPLKFD